ncbi:hypothetical protein L1987_13938 [Smallanthus sonchifolius]|uniref:Uncharacterized protein n=1 Tax=Smallanthus sonchifolius TaxID=185202 RepID=A0ACB9JIX4_9ASTR|nr:hypothetical protein L1987_13938 [Smallanthus sonchifolius]
MALTMELFHSFRGYDKSKDLWKALQKRFEGNSDIKKTFELKYPGEELVEKFLDALPLKFEMYTTLMGDPKFYGMTIDETIGKVQAHDMNLKRKESSGRPQIQDPSMYHGTNPPATSSANQSAIAKIVEDHVALFSSCMLAYENFTGGKLTDPETIEEDFNQEESSLAGTLMPSQSGSSNALVDQQDESFDWGVHLEDAIIAQTQVGLMTEIMEMMEAEEREASVADREESTTVVVLMAI